MSVAPLSRRNFLQLGAGAVVGGLALAACGTSGGAGSGPTSVLYWAAFSGKAGQDYYQKNFIDAFNAAHKDITAKMDVKQLNTLAQLTQTAVSAGNGPDVVYTDGPSSALTFAQSDKIIPLDSYATKYGWKDKFLPWAWELSQVKGKLYSVPAGYGSMVLYYNPATFQKNGWKVPTTAAEFAAVCTDAKAKGLIPVGAGNSGYAAQSEWYLTCFLNAAVGPGTLYKALTNKIPFTDDAFVTAITEFKAQIDKGWWGGPANNWFTNTDTAMFTGLANGTVAMYMTGTWSFDSMDTFFGEKAGNSATWDWAPLPSLNDAVPAGVFPLAVGTSLCVNAADKNPAAAAELIDYLTADPKRVLGYMAATGANPPPLKLSADQFPSSTDKRVARLYEAVPKSTNLGYASWAFLPPATDTYLYTEFDKVITGSLTPSQYCAGLQKSFATEFAKGATLVPFKPAA